MTIKVQREKLHLSQYRLASLANVSRFRLSLYERGEMELKPVELDCIQRALRAEADRLRSDVREIVAA